MSDQGAEALAGLVGIGVQRLSGIDLAQAAASQSIETSGMLADAAPGHGQLVNALYVALDEFDLAGMAKLLERI